MPRPKKIIKATPAKKTKKEPVQLVRGMHDILPKDQPYWEYIYHKAASLVKCFGFKKIDTPVLEKTSLFARGIGESTDIVQKEMFSFTDKSGDSVSMRPEPTAGICRAFVEHGMKNMSQPVKFYWWGPLFRHERPQSGRFRQFYQFGLETIGDQNPVLDAEIILITYKILSDIGFRNLEVQVNSIGCPECKPGFRDALLDYYSPKQQRLCRDCKRRLKKNPLRLLDCKQSRCKNISAEAPQIVDFLCEECHNHFKSVLEYLDELEIPYNLNPTLVRGLDYYTKTVFEVWPGGDEGFMTALAGGGRYDGLIEMLGEKETPAVGVGMGIERIIAKIKEKNIALPLKRDKPDVYLAQLGELAKKKSLKLFSSLIDHGFTVTSSFQKDSIKSQLRQADKRGVKLTIIYGQKEAVDQTVLLRDMETGIQEIVDINKITDEIKKRLNTSKSN